MKYVARKIDTPADARRAGLVVEGEPASTVHGPPFSWGDWVVTGSDGSVTVGEEPSWITQ